VSVVEVEISNGMLAVALYEQSCSSQAFNETYCHRENASSQLGSSTLATSLPERLDSSACCPCVRRFAIVNTV
jgi:hypothetical protein